MSNSAVQSMRSIDRFLREVAVTEKRAAEANYEPGSVGGPTEHPVKDVDDSTEEAHEGARAEENAKDVKAERGYASGDSKKAAARRARKLADDGKSQDGTGSSPGTAAQDQYQIGTKKAPTGQDSSVETASAKLEKDDTDTSHPASTANSSLDGNKYAEMSTSQLAKVAADLGNQLLAQLANSISHVEPMHSEGKEAADLAGQAGWELAGLLSGNFDKQAADTLVQSTLETIVKTAADDAEKVAGFWASYNAELRKQANDEAAGPGAAGVPDEAALMAAMAGSEGAPGGGMPPGAEGAEGGADVEQLAALLEQLGISPEELVAALSEGGAGDGAVNPPGTAAQDQYQIGTEQAPTGQDSSVAGGGLPPEAMAGAAPGMEVEASARIASKKQAAAKRGAADKSARDYIQEILERSRR